MLYRNLPFLLLGFCALAVAEPIEHLEILSDGGGIELCRALAIAPNSILTSLHCLVDREKGSVRTSLFVAGQPVHHIGVDPESSLKIDPAESTADFVILYVDRAVKTSLKVPIAVEGDWSRCRVLLWSETSSIPKQVPLREPQLLSEVVLASVDESIKRGDSGSPVVCRDSEGSEILSGLVQAVGPAQEGGTTISIQRLDIYNKWIQSHLR